MSNPTEKAELVKDLKRVIDTLGHTPSFKEYQKAGGRFGRKPFRRVFGSWGKALIHLGRMPQVGGGGSPIFENLDAKIPSYDGRGRVYTDDAIIGFDLHAPYHNRQLLPELLRVKDALGINTLILGGDTTDFKSLYYKEAQDAEFSWTEEMKLTKDVMATLCKEFEEVYWLKGNHDHRLARYLNSNKQMLELYHLILDFDNLHLLDTFYCEVNDWLLINHPMRCRKNKISFIEELSRRYRKSVLNGHTHRFVFSVDDSGNDVIGEGLHLTRADYHEYKSRELNLSSEWIEGFWIMRGRGLTPYVLHPRITNTLRQGGSYDNGEDCR